MGKIYDLEAVVNATGEPIKFSAAPVLASVLEGGVERSFRRCRLFGNCNPSSPSGYSIIFMDTAALDPGDDVEITYGDNTPIATTAIYCGSSTTTLELTRCGSLTLTRLAWKIACLNFYSVDPTSGRFPVRVQGRE